MGKTAVRLGFGFLVLAIAIAMSPALVAQARYMPGEVLIGPAAGKQAAMRQFVAEKELELIDEDRYSGVIRVRVPAGTELAWIADLTKHPAIEYAERNGIGQIAAIPAIPNDSHYTAQWHLHNTGQAGGAPGADIEAEAAWDLSTGASNVVVAVIDTGIDSDHPEFVGRIDPDGWDFFAEDNDPEATNPHGTQVAGVLGANANNNFGVTGVDWNCKILPILVIDPVGFGNAMDLAQGLNYCAAQDDVTIVTMSLQNYPADTTLQNAMAACSAAGKIIFSAAGNFGIGHADSSYPSSAPESISIGGTTNTDDWWNSSGTGNALDFVAAGHNVVTCDAFTHADISIPISGTSFAAPIAAGVASLLVARAQSAGLTLTQADVYSLLQQGAEDQVGNPSEDTPGRDNYFGHGRINARASLDLIDVLGPCVDGNVGMSGGGPFPVVEILGQSMNGIGGHVIPVPLGLPWDMSVAAPPTHPGGGPNPPVFVLWGFLGNPTPADLTPLPFGIGDMCIPPSPFSIPGTAPWSITIPAVMGPQPQVTFQGLIVDTPANNIAVTNLISAEFFTLPAPTINSVDPLFGSAGTVVTIHGENFEPGLSVDFNGTTVTPNTVTADAVTFALPSNPTCDSTISVQNPDGQFTASEPFNPSPSIANLITPAGTPAAGGVTTILVGGPFLPNTTVTIGGNPLNITTLGVAAIIGQSPPGTPGPTTVVVTSGNGCVVTHPYTYTP